jgi:hypothetical protein
MHNVSAILHSNQSIVKAVVMVIDDDTGVRRPKQQSNGPMTRQLLSEMLVLRFA